MIELLSVPYLDGGRDLKGLDCWGIVLEARKALGLIELPSFGGVARADVKVATRHYEAISAGMIVGEPQPGAIAAVLRGGLFVHAGVVIEADGRNWVMDMNPRTGARLHTLEDFLASYYKVVFYHDIDLPK